jgi:plasmid maintenance system antidote protein VapI
VLGRAPRDPVDLVNGNAGLSPEMALKIEKAFGVNTDILLRMRALHDRYTMRQNAAEMEIVLFTAPAPV